MLVQEGQHWLVGVRHDLRLDAAETVRTVGNRQELMPDALCLNSRAIASDCP